MGIPLLPISPAGSDKESNARAVSPMFEASMILLPSGAAWADDYIESMIRLPKGAHDDDADSTSQALNYLRKRTNAITELMQRELAENAERKLCANPKCTNGEGGTRKILGFNMLIPRIGEDRWCSEVPRRVGAIQAHTACNAG